mgnify:CR=1 FL=1
MTVRQYRNRRLLIALGRCPRCTKPVDPWPLKRPDVCAGLRVCIRQWSNIYAAEARLVVKG